MYIKGKGLMKTYFVDVNVEDIVDVTKKFDIMVALDAVLPVDTANVRLL
jgi:hypothetical protein